MTQKRIYIQAAEQISMQQPLSQQWMVCPVFHAEPYVHAVPPSFRDYLAPNEARRMSNIMKRALVTSLKVMKDTGIDNPDAIVTGTSTGCLDYTERILKALAEEGEQTVSPTHFMQSTHNTVSSALGIYTKKHGYNTTYSHGTLSFDFALLDTWMQMQLGKISTALVGGHEEMVDSYYELLKKTGYVGKEGMVPCGEVAVSMMLSAERSASTLCEMAGITVSNSRDAAVLRKAVLKMLGKAGLSMDGITAVMTGRNGNEENDAPYDMVAEQLFGDKPRLWYKHVFGENFTASAFGAYAAAHCLAEGIIPEHLIHEADAENLPDGISSPKAVILANHTGGRQFSFTLLKAL